MLDVDLIGGCPIVGACWCIESLEVLEKDDGVEPYLAALDLLLKNEVHEE
jgi:hypothetical protein